MLAIADTPIRQDAQSRWCLNDLHRAAGGEKRHQPANWLRLDATKALMAEIDHSSDMRSAQAVNGGTAPGTYVCKELVYAYAMWISPAFHLKVIRAYDAMSARPPIDPMQVLNDPAAMRGLLLTYTEKVIALESRVDELAPKAEALDRIAAADGSMNPTLAAKALQVQPKRLFEYLRRNHWIYRRPGSSGNVAYQDKIQAGYLTHKITTVQRDDGSEKVVEQVLVTGKGLANLSQALGVH